MPASPHRQPTNTTAPPSRRDQLTAESVPLGAEIVTSDGRRLGRVKRCTSRCFLVDARFAFDYWLSVRAVAMVADGLVGLGVTRREVERYLVDIDCLEDYDDLQAVPRPQRDSVLLQPA